jgi:GntR family transcriptional regulator, transcriptional repressor for pyruvate dehydrogenase complex
MWKPLTRQSLSDQVFEQLLGQIVHGEREPGSELPSERVLSEALGVNRGAVREALKRLAQARLVSIQQGGATRILDFRQTAGLDLMGTLLLRGDGAVDTTVARSIMEMRSALGPDIARLAALRGGSTAHAALQDQQGQMAQATGDLVAQQRLALAYWGVLADSCGNLAYRLAYNTLRDSYLSFGALLTEVLAVEHADTAAYEALTAAVTAGDADRAHALAKELVRRGEQAVGHLMKNLDASEQP